MLPSDLLALLTSGRSCSEPHRVQMRAGGSTPVDVGSERTCCQFTLCRAGAATPIELKNASCLLELVATPAEDGRVELRFTPVVRHGSARREARAVRDASGERRWDVEVHRATEQYSALSWEITVRPEEYVVVGTRLDREDSLGHRFFVDSESSSPTQRVLVIRSGRISSETDVSPANSSGAVPPLALQAGWHSARGTAP
jgi:hypothetical protein